MPEGKSESKKDKATKEEMEPSEGYKVPSSKGYKVAPTSSKHFKKVPSSKAVSITKIRDFATVEMEAFDLASDLARNLARARARDLALAVALARDLALALASDLDRASVLVRDLASASASGLDRSRASTLDPASSSDFASASASVWAIILILDRLLSNDLDSDIDLDKTLAFITENYNVSEALINFLQTGVMNSPTPIILKLEEQNDPHAVLTPDYIANVVMPYIQAVARLQNVIDEARGLQPKDIQVNSITRGSVDVSMDGVGDILRFIRDVITPWRRKKAKEIVELDTEIKTVEIIEREAAIQQQQASTQITQAEADVALRKVNAEMENLLLDIEDRKLGIKRKEFDLHKDKIQLALSLLDRLEVELAEEQKIAWVMEMVKPLSEIVESPLEFVALIDSNSESKEADGEVEQS